MLGLENSVSILKRCSHTRSIVHLSYCSYRWWSPWVEWIVPGWLLSGWSWRDCLYGWVTWSTYCGHKRLVKLVFIIINMLRVNLLPRVFFYFEGTQLFFHLIHMILVSRSLLLPNVIPTELFNDLGYILFT